ncbi:histidine phosphatase superfamily [Suillus fuscotomentosus]|uniref:Histidine phosphatase superfamily n=1 Tax=Suillus fuscotomentosus TaxID=1912939 RepID=A0AAD4E9V8_9AGAM|nr:histidine phosphatase superfamily [Suillus fuscotomentosus]KAG1902334.1 histidine phosphatase superfamily [Suillus fuscotomentosus]
MQGTPVPLDVESYPVTPEGLDLEQVHIYVRHGERTPVRVRMSDPPASIPADWQMCDTAKSFHETVAGHVPTVDDGLWYRKVVENRHGKTAEGLCLLGELTDIGKKSTYSFGTALRSLYVDRLKFLPQKLEDERLTYFRSTNIARTIESLQHIVHGVYPPSTCAPGTIPSIIIRNAIDENLVSNTLACKRLALLELKFAEVAVAVWNPRLKPLDMKVSKYIGGMPLRLDGTPRASGILDTVRSAAAHGFRVPPEFMDDDVIGLIESAVTAEWFNIKSEDGRRLGMGRLLAGAFRKNATQGPTRFNRTQLNFSCTRRTTSTLAALLCTFDLFDDKWPPFTSSVTFELFRKRTPASGLRALSSVWRRQDEHYVRMRYKNKNMVLPMCAEEGKHLPGSPEFCTLEAFQRRVEELTPRDWAEECRT